MKNIWILNHYAGKMYFDKGGRHYSFAEYLSKHGYNVTVFCSNAKHFGEKGLFFDENVLWSSHHAEEINTEFVFVRSRAYEGNGISRILNMFDFFRNLKKAAREYARTNSKPDIILASSVHPLTLSAGLSLAKTFGVKCICEMRDLWPEALVAYSARLTKNNPVIKYMYFMEKQIYSEADALIFTQEGGPDYVRKQKWDTENGGPVDLKKAYHINNGVNLETFDRNADSFVFEDNDLDNEDIFKVVYTGAVQRINNLGILLDAAKLIHNPKIRFLFWGFGDEVPYLKQRLADENITNVVFKGYVNKQYIPSIVKRSDLNLVHWEMNDLLQVGESYNKAFDYLAAGKPVFYTVRPNYSIVERYNCGRLTEGFSPEDLADGIERIAALSSAEKKQMGENARKAAAQYDFGVLTDKLINIINSLEE